MTQRVTLITVAGAAAARISTLFAAWLWAPESQTTKLEADNLADRLKAHEAEPSFVYSCGWIDAWLMGNSFASARSVYGNRYLVNVLSQSEVSDWATSLPDQHVEHRQLKTRLQDAAEAWVPEGQSAVVVFLREVLGGSRTDEEIVAAATTTPAWLKPAIYLDHHATTPVDPRVLAAMLPFFSEKYGNPSSTNHSFGSEAAEAVAAARQQVADLLGCLPREILFTSGATESNNLALKGVAAAYRSRGAHVVSVVTEHQAVLDPLKRLQREGCEITLLPVDEHGFVTPAQVEAALTDKTILVSIMAANNEVGTLQPLAEIGRLCKSRGMLLHTDAAQAVGKMPLDVEALGVDLLSLSAHKLYGPKGVGALYVRRRELRVRLEPLQEGGGQENNLRSGTLNVPGIVGLGAACQMAKTEMAEEGARIGKLRDRLWAGLSAKVPEVFLNGPPLDGARLSGNLNVSFAYVQGEALLLSLKDVAVSSGSACTTQSQEPSHVLRAIGRGDDLADASLRFGLGRFNTEAEVDWVIDHVAANVAKLRELSSAWKHRSA